MGPNHRLVPAIAASVAILSACHTRPTIEKPSAAAANSRHPLSRAAVTAPGVVEPWSGEVRLSSMEPGVLLAISVVEGQQVRKGDLLARLEDSQQRHAVAIAEAELRQAAAVVEGLTSTREELLIAGAELQSAAARAEQQRRESRRAESLSASGTLPTAEIERSMFSARDAEAVLEAAEARLVAAKRGARPSDRQIARARLEAAEARRSDALAAVARREVRATLDGVVIWSRYHPGEFYAQDQGPLFVLGDLQHLQIKLEVDDADAAALVAGAACQLRSDNGESLGEGSVVRIALEYGSRSLASERPTSRTDARVREVFVEALPATSLVPGQRVWGTCPASLHAAR
jgi:multidrug resistance efflux pump